MTATFFITRACFKYFCLNVGSIFEQVTKKPGLKRPKNGFIRFAMEFRKHVAEEHPNLDNREISRILGVRWRKLTMSEKYAYE